MNMEFKRKKRIKVDSFDKSIIILVGLGGTGARVAEIVTQILQNSPKKNKLVLIDGDYVELKNLLRQLFSSGDIGHNKATATAQKCINSNFANSLNLEKIKDLKHKPYKKLINEIKSAQQNSLDLTAAFNNKAELPSEILRTAFENVDIVSYDDFIENKEDILKFIPMGYFPIILGASDCLKLRKTLCDVMDSLNNGIYIDGGNGESTGQTVFTYKKDGEYITDNFFKVYPEMLEDLKKSKFRSEMSCAERMVSSPQTMMANILSANCIVSYVDKIFNRQSINSYAIEFNTEDMMVRPKFMYY